MVLLAIVADATPADCEIESFADAVQMAATGGRIVFKRESTRWPTCGGLRFG